MHAKTYRLAAQHIGRLVHCVVTELVAGPEQVWLSAWWSLRWEYTGGEERIDTGVLNNLMTFPIMTDYWDWSGV